MCALFGYLDYGKRMPAKLLQKLVQALAIASEVRGTHATGIAYNRDDTLTIFKRPKPAHKLHFHIPEETAAVMGHTRYTTQGDQKFNQNNHPFHGQVGVDFALAHNGVLYNDDLLRKQLQLPDTTIETDSFIMVQLIESQGDLSFDSLRHAAEKVRGSFTFTLLDRYNSLYFIKGDSPLHLIHFPTLGLYVYSSTADIMTAAFRRLSVRFPKYEIIPVEEGELLRIAPDGSISRDRFQMQDDFACWHSWRFYSFYNSISARDSSMFEHEDENALYMMELSSYYGVDEELIRYLHESGFTLDEIEEYLMHPDSYGEDLSVYEPV